MATSFAILGTLASMLASTAPHPMCSIAALPIFRDSAATYLVGTATVDTALARPGGPPSRFPGVAAVPRPATFGQTVKVDRLSGPDAVLVESALARRGSRAVLIVPWGFGAACEPIAWPASAQWEPVGVPATYRLQLRPEWSGSTAGQCSMRCSPSSSHTRTASLHRAPPMVLL
jgi:hypothetical protein